MADLTPEQAATLERWRNFLDDDANPVTNGYVGDPDSAYHFFQVNDLLSAPMRQPYPPGLIFNPTLSVCERGVDVSVDANPAPRNAADLPR